MPGLHVYVAIHVQGRLRVEAGSCRKNARRSPCGSTMSAQMGEVIDNLEDITKESSRARR